MTRLAASSFDWAIRVNREASPRGDLGASIYWIRHGACNDSMAPYYSEELPMSKRPPTSACAAAASGLKTITASIERKPHGFVSFAACDSGTGGPVRRAGSRAPTHTRRRGEDAGDRRRDESLRAGV